MIDLFATIKIALRSLRANKMRSFLTSLGIIIGVSAVIIMLAVGSGANQKLSEQISNLGSNVLIVRPGSSKRGGITMGSGSLPTLKLNDAIQIKKRIAIVKESAPLFNSTAQLVFENQNWLATVQGTTDAYLSINNWKVIMGRELTQDDVDASSKVCILGNTVAINLFGDMNPINKVIRVNGVPFTVIGLLDIKGQSMRGSDMDDVVIVPITTAQKKLFGTAFPGMINMIMVQAIDEESLAIAEKDINELLRQLHNIKEGDDEDFTVRNISQILDTIKQSAQIMALLLGSIASISLIVGGIGIMNIMLVSVTERTREIGIRLAVGAKISDIRMQFLIEAIILSIMGGMIGIAIGVIISNLILIIFDFPIKISFLSIALSFGFSACIGIFFGFYPAFKASQLNPIDALRHE